MEKVRKTLKAFALVTIVFFIMTMILCALITYTGFRENWTQIGLIIALSISAFILGCLQANIIGSRGLLVGIVSSALFISLILVLVSILFNSNLQGFKQYLFLFIPLLAGGLGGVFGINRNKS